MRVLIFTSSGGTAHDAAAYALRAWLQRWDPTGEVWVEHVLEKASMFTRGGVSLYNWIQRHAPWMHQIYWRVVELEDVTKPGTLLFGRSYVIRLLRRLKPDLLISNSPAYQSRPFRSRPACLAWFAVRHLLYGARGWLWLQS